MSDIVQQVQVRMMFSLAKIAKSAGIKEGDYLQVECKDGGIFLRPVRFVPVQPVQTEESHKNDKEQGRN